MILSVMTAYYPSQDAEAQTQQRCYDDICHVKITKDGYAPKSLIVKIGTTVVWTNTDDSRHTVTSGSPGEVIAPLKSSLIEEGGTYEFVFEFAGSYEGTHRYFDQITKTMRGEIIVEPEEEKTPEPEPELDTVPIDFGDPGSGVMTVSLLDGRIKSMEIVRDTHSLIITVENVPFVTTLDITLDRELIDSSTDGGEKDTPFVVMVDGKEAFFDETSSTPTERGLEIVVPRKAEQIEIMGTQVIPEFPVAVMAVVTGVIIAAAVAAAGRFGRNPSPRRHLLLPDLED